VGQRGPVIPAPGRARSRQPPDTGARSLPAGKRNAGGTALEDSLPDTSPLAEDALDRLQQLNLLRAGLDRLDARCRDLLLLLFGDDDERPAYDEVARRLALPIGSIGPTRSRCLAKLRQLVEAPAQNG
jgi:DNA-directed RNA polymerase specialized sigma24 family protein